MTLSFTSHKYDRVSKDGFRNSDPNGDVPIQGKARPAPTDLTRERVDDAVNAQVPGFRRTATRADLLDAVYASCPSLSRSQAREIFEMALEEVSETLIRGESVKLRSFGLFSVREKRERIGRNPRTGQEVPIKPRRVLTFKASPVLLQQVNGESGKGEGGEE